jgi:ABC-type phosphate transport system substrate-binding protein
MLRMRLFNRICLTILGLALSLPASGAAADVVAVVSADNPVGALSKHQVVNIFLGKTRQFPDGSPAVPVDQAEGSAARDKFYLELAGKSPAQIKGYWSKVIFTGRGQPPPEVANGLQVKKFIMEHPNAIGYIDEQLVDGDVKALRAK